MNKTLFDVIPDLGKKPIHFDGGFGALLQSRGLPQGHAPSLWNIENPAVVKDVYQAYLAAGADIITTNTFTAHRWALGGDAPAAALAGTRLAREAVREAGHGLVALDIGPSGRLMEPFGDLPFEEAVSGFAGMVAAGLDANPDIIIMETFTDAYEAKTAVLGAQTAMAGRDALPILVSFSFSENGRLLTGLDVRGVAAMFEELGVSAIGVNCGMGPDVMANVVRALAQSTRLPVFANPNAGLPDMVDRRSVYRLAPDGYATLAASLFDEGAWIVGGCCGTTPGHIKTLRALSEGRALLPRPLIVPAVATSSSRSYLVEDISAISDALDAAANPAFRSLLSGMDEASYEDAAEQAIEWAMDAQDEGADALLVNLDGAADARFYTALIPRLQSAVQAPLMFADTDEVAWAAAYCMYNGHPLTIKGS